MPSASERLQALIDAQRAGAAAPPAPPAPSPAPPAPSPAPTAPPPAPPAEAGGEPSTSPSSLPPLTPAPSSAAAKGPSRSAEAGRGGLVDGSPPPPTQVPDALSDVFPSEMQLPVTETVNIGFEEGATAPLRSVARGGLAVARSLIPGWALLQDPFEAIKPEPGMQEGGTGVDVAKLTTTATRARLLKMSKDDPDTPIDVGTVVREASRAHDDVLRWMSEAGVPYVDTDPEGRFLIEQLRTEQEGTTLGRVLAPLKATLAPTAWTIGGPDSAHPADTYNETWGYSPRSLFNFVTRATRASVGSPIATAVAATGKSFGEGDDPTVFDVARAWGGPEHMELVSKGHDIVTLANKINIAAAVTPTALVQVPRSWAGKLGAPVAEGKRDPVSNVLNIPAALVLALTDFDMFQAAGMATRGVGIGAQVAKTSAKARVLKAAEEGTKPGIVAKALAPDAALALDVYRRAEAASAPVLSAIVKGEKITPEMGAEAVDAINTMFDVKKGERGGAALANGLARAMLGSGAWTTSETKRAAVATKIAKQRYRDAVEAIHDVDRMAEEISQTAGALGGAAPSAVIEKRARDMHKEMGRTWSDLTETDKAAYLERAQESFQDVAWDDLPEHVRASLVKKARAVTVGPPAERFTGLLPADRNKWVKAAEEKRGYVRMTKAQRAALVDLARQPSRLKGKPLRNLVKGGLAEVDGDMVTITDKGSAALHATATKGSADVLADAAALWEEAGKPGRGRLTAAEARDVARRAYERGGLQAEHAKKAALVRAKRLLDADEAAHWQKVAEGTAYMPRPGTRAAVAARFKIAELATELTFRTLEHRDLVNQHRVLEALGQGRKPRAPSTVAKGLMEDFNDARGRMYGAVLDTTSADEEIALAGEQAYEAARRDLVKARAGLVIEAGNAAADNVAAAVEASKKKLDVAEEAFENAMQRAKKVGVLPDDDLKEMEALTRSAKSAMKQVPKPLDAEDLHGVVAAHVGLELMRRASGALQGTRSDMDFMSGLRATMRAQQHIGVSLWRTGLQSVSRVLTGFRDPAEQLWGSTNTKVYKAIKGARNHLDMSVADIALIRKRLGAFDINSAVIYDFAGNQRKVDDVIPTTKEGKRAVGFARAVMRYLDTTETVKGSFVNTLRGDSLWTTAGPLLRDAARNNPDDEIFKAMARCFLPRTLGHGASHAATGTSDVLKNMLLTGHPKGRKGIIADVLPEVMDKAAWKALSKEQQEEVLVGLERAGARQVTPGDVLEEMLSATAAAAAKTGDPTMRKGRAIEIKRDLLNTEAARAAAFFGSAVSEAAALAVGSQHIEAIAGEVSPTLGKASSILSGGSQKPWSKGVQAQFADVVSLFGRLGAPYSEAVRRDMSESNKRIMAGLRFIEDDTTGRGLLVMRTMQSDLEGRVGNIAKVLHEYESAHGGETIVSRMISTAIRWFNTSILTGLIFNKPAYYVMNYMGNIGQTWAEHGIGMATRLAAETAPQAAIDTTRLAAVGTVTNITRLRPVKAAIEKAAPVFPPAIKEGFTRSRRQMADKLRVAEDRVLPTVTESMFDPFNSAVFSTRTFSNDELVPGTRYSWGEVRRELVDGTVLTSFMGSTGLQDIARRMVDDTPGLGGEFVDVADAIEKRQRVALFGALLRKGLTPAEASQGVLTALYDWYHPLGRLEQAFASKMFMFWRFQRLALTQAWSLLTDPLTRDYDRTAGVFADLAKEYTPAAIMMGKQQSRLANLHDMIKAQEELRAGMQLGMSEEEIDPIRRVYPYYFAEGGSTTRWTTRSTSPAERTAWGQMQRGSGRFHDSVAYTMPAATPIEMVATFAMVTQGAAIGFGVMPHPETGERGFHPVRGAQVSLEGLADMLGGRYTAEAMKSVLAKAGLTRRGGIRVDRDAVPVYSPFTEATLRTAERVLPGQHLLWRNARSGRLETSAAAAAVYYGVLLPIGVEARRTFDPVLEWKAMADAGAYKDSWTKGIDHLLGRYTGIMKPTYFDATGTLTREQKYRQREKMLEMKESAAHLPP